MDLPGSLDPTRRIPVRTGRSLGYNEKTMATWTVTCDRNAYDNVVKIVVYDDRVIGLRTINNNHVYYTIDDGEICRTENRTTYLTKDR